MGLLAKRAPRAASLSSTSLPHCGFAYGPLDTVCAVSASLFSPPQSISLAHSDHQARLCDSVRPVSPKVQRCPLRVSESCKCPYLAFGKRSPTGEGRDRDGPSSGYEVRVLQPLLHCTPRKAVGHDRSWTCEFWIWAFTSYRSKCSQGNAFSSASVPKIGLQRST